MEYQNYIGIDPDSKGYFCVPRNRNTSKSEPQYFNATKKDLDRFLKWAETLPKCCIAIEGANGLSTPLEALLRKKQITFYTFTASTIAYSRKSHIGQNKNNLNDAKAVVEFAMDADSNLRLDKYKRMWFPDKKLRLLTRTRSRLVKQQTAELNNLWKLLRYISMDLYLTAAEMQSKLFQDGKILKKEYIRQLFMHSPDPNSWKELSNQEMLTIMNLRSSESSEAIIKELKVVASYTDHISKDDQFLLTASIDRLNLLKSQIKQIEKLLVGVSENNKAVKTLAENKGIGITTASVMVAEIIDIRRFINDDNLAAYCGLCSREYSTGHTQKFIKRYSFNSRLKDAMVCATNHFIQNNPNHRISGYFESLLKRNLERKDAKKKAGRALLRMIFKQLSGLIEQEMPEKKKEDKVAKCSKHKKGNTSSSFKRHDEVRKKKTKSQEYEKKNCGKT